MDSFCAPPKKEEAIYQPQPLRGNTPTPACILQAEINYKIYKDLHKDSEEDECNNGSEEHGSRELIIQQVAKWKGDSSSQAPIWNYELVLGGEFHNAKSV